MKRYNIKKMNVVKIVTEQELDRFLSKGYTVISEETSDVDPKDMNFYELRECTSSIKAAKANNEIYSRDAEWYGDSIAFGMGYADGYAGVIGSSNNMTINNKAVSGSTLAVIEGKTSIYTTLANAIIPETVKYITIEGFVNDADAIGVAKTEQMGVITQDYASALDTSTFCGAMEATCKLLVTTYPTKKYGVILFHGHRLYSVYNAVRRNTKAICEKWGVPCLDLSGVLPPLREIAALKTAYTTDLAGGGDGIHPNEDGYRLLYAPAIEAWMKAGMPTYSSGYQDIVRIDRGSGTYTPQLLGSTTAPTYTGSVLGSWNKINGIATVTIAMQITITDAGTGTARISLPTDITPPINNPGVIGYNLYRMDTGVLDKEPVTAQVSTTANALNLQYDRSGSSTKRSKWLACTDLYMELSVSYRHL